MGDHAPTDGQARKLEATPELVQEIDTALDALRNSHDQALRQRALDVLERASKRLRDHLH